MPIYIISVSEMGTLPSGKLDKTISDLQKLGQIYEVCRWKWNLTNGLNEIIYKLTRPEEQPLTKKEFQKIKENFTKEKKNIEFFRLEKIVS